MEAIAVTMQLMCVRNDRIDGERRQCVVCLPSSTPMPQPLLGELARRSVPVTLANDPPAVMLALAQRASLAMILVEPEQQPHLRELLSAVREHHPSVRLWSYRAGAGGLRRFDAADREAPADQGATSADHPHHGLTHAQAQALTGGGDSGVAAAEPRAPLVTAEELQMLLGPVEDQPQEPFR